MIRTLISRWLAGELFRAVSVTLIFLLGLFLFFAVVEELDRIQRGSVSLQDVLLLEFLGIPARLYDLLPIAILVGSILALANLAARHEITILRSAGLSGFALLGRLSLAGLPFVVAGILISELLVPVTELRSGAVRLEQGETSRGAVLRSGHWLREQTQGQVRILNFEELAGDGTGRGVAVYLFGAQGLEAILQAERGRLQSGELVLEAGTQIIVARTEPTLARSELLNPRRTANSGGAANFDGPENAGGAVNSGGLENAGSHASSELIGATSDPFETPYARSRFDTLSLPTALSAERVLARAITPERMSLFNLVDYVRYLSDNRLTADRQVVAIWRKLIYPFTLLVMIAIAAPVALMQTRRGGVSGKVFIGVLLGVGFHMLSQTSLNLGLLYQWPAWLTALAPNMVALLIALGVIAAIDYRNTLARIVHRLSAKPANPAASQT